MPPDPEGMPDLDWDAPDGDASVADDGPSEDHGEAAGEAEPDSEPEVASDDGQERREP